MPADRDSRTDAEPAPWVVAVTVPAAVGLPDLGPARPADVIEWVWMRLGEEGLLAIDEGSFDVTEAAATGLVPGPLVIDTAAAPPERDWVAHRSTARIELLCRDESAARAAAALLTTIAGLGVDAPRPAPATPVGAVQEPVAVPGFGWVLPPGGDPVIGDAADDVGAAVGAARVIIDAGTGFGTGLHPTTRLCLRALARHSAEGSRLDRVLDVGAGSGILGIAAALAGSGHVDAVEIDPRVHRAIVHNAVLNGVAARLRLATTLAELALPGDGRPYDIVLANIVAPVLVEMATDLCRRAARPGGGLILSGLRGDDVADITQRYVSLLGTAPTCHEEEGWLCLVFRT